MSTETTTQLEPSLDQPTATDTPPTVVLETRDKATRPRPAHVMQTMAMLGLLAAGGHNDFPIGHKGPKSWKPTFTAEEIEYIGTLDGKAKKLAVSELRRKYLAQREAQS